MFANFVSPRNSTFPAAYFFTSGKAPFYLITDLVDSLTFAQTKCLELQICKHFDTLKYLLVHKLQYNVHMLCKLLKNYITINGESICVFSWKYIYKIVWVNGCTKSRKCFILDVMWLVLEMVLHVERRRQLYQTWYRIHGINWNTGKLIYYTLLSHKTQCRSVIKPFNKKNKLMMSFAFNKYSVKSTFYITVTW